MDLNMEICKYSRSLAGSPHFITESFVKIEILQEWNVIWMLFLVTELLQILVIFLLFTWFCNYHVLGR